MTQKVVPGSIYTHFKEGKKYQIITTAMHTETEEKLVIYQAMYGDFKTYARPLEMFLSKVDKGKYPDAAQEYRFELMQEKQEEPVEVRMVETKVTVVEEQIEAVSKKKEETAGGIHPEFLRFLDAESTSERLKVLRGMRDVVDDTMINSIAVVMDVTVKEGRLQERFDELVNCIQLKEQYELNRFR